MIKLDRYLAYVYPPFDIWQECPCPFLKYAKVQEYFKKIFKKSVSWNEVINFGML